MTRPESQPAFSRLTPCGETRRELLWEAGGGFVATALTFLLGESGYFTQPAHADPGPIHPARPFENRKSEIENPKSPGPLAPRSPHFPGKAKRVIFIFNYGGVSQVDTFDPKPELNRRTGEAMPNLDSDPLFKSRNPGKLLGSTRTWKRYGQAGIEVSDLFPQVGSCIDDIAVIRSLYADTFAHGSGLLQMNTGFVRTGYPSLGSWVTYGLGTENQNLPAFVVLLDHRGGPISGPQNWTAGFMPATYQGTQFRSTGDPILNMRPAEGVTPAQQRQQLEMLTTLQKLRGPASCENSELMARIQSYELAFRMQAAAPEAVDLSRESAATRKLYGIDDGITDKFGRRCLVARRLVERGVRFVQVYSGGGHFDDSWDAHGDVNSNHELHARETDKPIAGLLRDLKSRGLLDETLVVWSSEFGRTPTNQGGKGRDHSPRGFSVWMAGGGVKGGQAIGRTDDFGYAAVQDKVHVHDLHATILHLMGLNHLHLTYLHSGRNMRITDVSGAVVRSLVG